MAVKTDKRYKTQEICSKFDISKATLYKWEKEGLITNVGRDWRNWRVFTEKNIMEIKRIIKGRDEKRG